MLITHVKPTELWRKKVYDTEDHFLGEVLAIASRRGVVRKVLVQRAHHGQPVRLVTPADSRVEADTLFVPVPQPTMLPFHLVR
jgi:hypothetical protein